MAKKKNPQDQTRSQAKRSTSARRAADRALGMRITALEQRVANLEGAGKPRPVAKATLRGTRK